MSDSTTPKDRLIYPLALGVFFVWAAAALYSFVSSAYTPLEVVTPVMLILAGYVFGIRITRDAGGHAS